MALEDALNRARDDNDALTREDPLLLAEAMRQRDELAAALIGQLQRINVTRQIEMKYIASSYRDTSRFKRQEWEFGLEGWILPWGNLAVTIDGTFLFNPWEGVYEGDEVTFVTRQGLSPCERLGSPTGLTTNGFKKYGNFFLLNQHEKLGWMNGPFEDALAKMLVSLESRQ